MTALYNEIDPYAARWLGNLACAGHIAAGPVDERSIADLAAEDVEGYRQVHLFAGIGGWSHALRLADWPDDRPVWTGSCPCQPFSAAGKRMGTSDSRHLWPEFRRLIAECRPATIFGEQVASRAGREWLAGVRADLEALGYALGAADLCAASVGAPHIRQRLFWVAHANGRIAGVGYLQSGGQQRQQPQDRLPRLRMGDAEGAGLQGARTDNRAQGNGHAARQSGLSDQTMAWSREEWLGCLDGKARRAESGIHPLAHGVPNRVGKLRAYGNAIVPQVAAVFIKAFMDAAPRP